MPSPARSRPASAASSTTASLALVASDAFEEAWVEANRTAHEELVAALTGRLRGRPVEIDDGAVSVNLAVLINTAQAAAGRGGFGIAERIPEVAASFTIVQSDDLAKVQNLLGLLDNLSTWLPVVGLACSAAAVMIARDRRRMVLVVGPRGGRLACCCWVPPSTSIRPYLSRRPA